ncbi:MAG: hypothetical protein Q8P86_03400 [bacterium]|nr:hypothetical protein [bacterium]
MNNKYFVLACAVAFVGVTFYFGSGTTGREAIEDLLPFAQCLAEKEVTMYGAAWCAHCQNEKKRFGDSFDAVPYVECPDNPQVCLDKEIEGYPTWILPDGRKLLGEQGLEKLAKESGCPLP